MRTVEEVLKHLNKLLKVARKEEELSKDWLWPQGEVAANVQAVLLEELIKFITNEEKEG